MYISDVDMCNQITCVNGGTCTSVLGSYRCNCLPGWTGQYCGVSKFNIFIFRKNQHNIEIYLNPFLDCLYGLGGCSINSSTKYIEM